MILLREAQLRDAESLERLATVPGFISLSGDRDELALKISRSRSSFGGTISDPMDAKYIFVAEDLATGRVVGTSMIAARHGSIESPHFYFEVGQEEKFSNTINTGFIHGTLKLKYETNGPTELGGLVLDQEARNSPERVGRQLSFVRFLYLGLYRESFKRRILAELLPPLNIRGQSPLWEAIGRRFTNMDYWEADRLCQQSKEFIFSLFPSGKIYTTFLTAEARNALGKVGKETEPVLHMLQKVGFAYRNQVDPFDGGPHLWAHVDELAPVKNVKAFTWKSRPGPGGGRVPEEGLLCPLNREKGVFRALAVRAFVEGSDVTLSEADNLNVGRTLGLSDGDPVSFMRYY